jgi:hypothetical protein
METPCLLDEVPAPAVTGPPSATVGQLVPSS